jgi:hypothetical protein
MESPWRHSKETKMNDTTDTAQLFLEIAKRNMPSVETLETRNRDALDFHDIAVWSIRQALAEAYAAGQAAAKRSRKRNR